MSLHNIFFLGPEGSYSHSCALKLKEIITQVSLEPLVSISAIKEAVACNKEAMGLFPVENSLGGSVTETLDGLLNQSEDTKVLLEYVMKIEHCLLGFGKKQELQEIRAHYQAFNQCEEYLKKNFSKFKRSEFPSNSAAVESLASLDSAQQNTYAAIGSMEAAKRFNVPIIENQINDSSENYTRFWLIGHKGPLSLINESKQYLCSLAFQIPRDEPGGLLKVLQVFASRSINLTKIESRPTKGRLCEYTFYIDFLAPDNWKEEGKEIIKNIQSICSLFRFLGHYSVFPHKDNRFAI